MQTIIKLVVLSISICMSILSLNADLVVNEFMAENRLTIADGDGDYSDWVELYNNGSESQNLGGYYLTDDKDELTKWRLPNITISPGGYMLIFASGKEKVDSQGYLHTNFSLSRDGEYLGLVYVDGTTVLSDFGDKYAPQRCDVSYGYCWGNGANTRAIRGAITSVTSEGYFLAPSPGSGNSATVYSSIVEKPKFSQPHGFYEGPFTLALSTDTPGAEIRYTLDGSEPSLSNGTIYTNSLTVETTTTIRAIAYKYGSLSSDINTRTYIYVDDVAKQPANPAGWPDTWGVYSGTVMVPADYEMDSRVVEKTQPGYSVRDALLDIPTVSVAMKLDDFAGPDNGIYSHPTSRWERKCSVEYIHPDGKGGFQENCKIEVHGNASRTPQRMQKHSLRLTFTGEYGASKLKYPLFKESDVETFNQLVLRACFTDSWALVSWQTSRYRPNDSQYIRDIWMKESFRDMGHVSSYGNYVHLYVNGIYFGIHNLTERLAEDFYCDHIGGKPEDWECNEDFRNEGPHWKAMELINASSHAGYSEICNYLDVDNFADYMLLHLYGDAEDWPSHNGYAAANIGSGDGRFRFFVWDQEIALDYHGRAATRINTDTDIGRLFTNLRQNVEFRLLFADRFQKHCFNGGALSIAEAQNRYLEIAGWIDKAIVAESARWGDTQASTPYGSMVAQPSPLDNIDHDLYPPAPNDPSYYFTREDSWIVERDNVVNNYIPAIHNKNNSYALINLLRVNSLYPLIDAAEFLINDTKQHGGRVDKGDVLTIFNANGSGKIYYTVDGSDPRLPGGAVSPVATIFETGDDNKQMAILNFNDEWKYLYDGSDQGVLWHELDFDDSTWLEGAARLGFGGDGEVTNIGPKVDGRRCAYFRKKFTVDSHSNFTELRLNLLYDDGAVIYLNGNELARPNMPATGTINFDTLSIDSSGDGSTILISDIDPELLVDGENILAVEVHQHSDASSDISFQLGLNAVVSSASVEPSEIILNESICIKARILNGTEWSALSEATYGVGPITEKLRISEIMYHPETPPEAEFVELQNISDQPINLNLVRFSMGIDFVFPNIQLGAGEFAVVVQNEAAFRTQYPNFTGVIAGIFSGVLDDSGERLTLVDASGSIIHSFKYSDEWYKSSDGEGFSLNVRDTSAIEPDSWGDKSTWTNSTYKHGSPGKDDIGVSQGEIVISEISPVALAGASGEFIEIYNRSESDVNISGWMLEGVDFIFPDDSVVKSAEAIVVASDLSTLSLPESVSSWQWTSGELADSGEALRLLTGDGKVIDEVHYFADNSWPVINSTATLELKKSGLNNSSGVSWRQSWYKGGSPGQKNTIGHPLILTEIYYNAPSTQGVDDDYEFLELYNRGDFRIDLSGYEFVEGISYIFPAGSSLDPGEYVLVASNSNTYSGNGYQVFQWTSGSLSNSGEAVRLEDTDAFKVFDVQYDTKLPWPLTADGKGSSLMLKNLAILDLDKVESWTSSVLGGQTPGAKNPVVEHPRLLVNEVLTHTDWPQVDFVELYNPTENDVDVGGWWLTDDKDDMKKFRIPDGTVIPALGFLVVYEDNDGNAGNNLDLPPQFFGSAFSLSSHGEEIYLFSPALDYFHGFDFPASENGVSFGRHLNSVGNELFPVLSTVTPARDNAPPAMSNVIFSEIMFAPAATGSEFVEILNCSSEPVVLFDPKHPENRWKISGIEFTFPAQFTIGAGEALVLIPVQTNVALFREQNSLPEDVRILQYTGALANEGERLTLLKPDKPDVDPASGETFIPYIGVESVKYDNTLPWPAASAGGSSIVRVYPVQFADDPASWLVGDMGGSPGQCSVVQLAVSNGSGSGFYFSGTLVQVKADNCRGAVFHHWDGAVVDPLGPVTYVNLAEDVSVSAFYTPEIVWQEPATVSYGTVISALQLNASSMIEGVMSYTTPVGVLLPGQYQLQVDFTPNDTGKFVSVSKIVGLNVAKAVLNFTAVDKSVREGEQIPELTYAVSGLVNDDLLANAVTGKPELSTTATVASDPGVYSLAIRAGDLAAENYSFNFVNGYLLIYERERPNEVEITLYPGWNLISQPFENLSAVECFDETQLLGDLWRWKNEYLPHGLEQILDTEVGFWVFSLSKQNVTLKGRQAVRKDDPAPINGWNMVGSLLSLAANEFASLSTWKWDAQKQVYQLAEQLEPGIGYWIFKAIED